MVGLVFQFGPVLGLFGTVLGMVRAFSTMGAEGEGQAEALAGDIGIALITTAIGLVVALVGIALIIVAITVLKYRPIWLFWILIPLLCRILSFGFPVGLIIGSVALTLLICYRKVFLDQKHTVDTAEFIHPSQGEIAMQEKRTVGQATASLVLGILSLVMFGILTAIPAVICGHIAKSKIKKDPENLAGDGVALAGLITGYLGIVPGLMVIPILAAVAIPLMCANQDLAQEIQCEANLSTIQIAKQIYVGENGTEEGVVLSKDDLASFLGSDPEIYLCPSEGTYSINPIGTPPECSEHGALE